VRQSSAAKRKGEAGYRAGAAHEICFQLKEGRIGPEWRQGFFNWRVPREDCTLIYIHAIGLLPTGFPLCLSLFESRCSRQLGLATGRSVRGQRWVQ
jgi:hypothetical protein